MVAPVVIPVATVTPSLTAAVIAGAKLGLALVPTIFIIGAGTYATMKIVGAVDDWSENRKLARASKKLGIPVMTRYEMYLLEKQKGLNVKEAYDVSRQKFEVISRRVDAELAEAKAASNKALEMVSNAVDEIKAASAMVKTLPAFATQAPVAG